MFPALVHVVNASLDGSGSLHVAPVLAQGKLDQSAQKLLEGFVLEALRESWNHVLFSLP